MLGTRDGDPFGICLSFLEFRKHTVDGTLGVRNTEVPFQECDGAKFRGWLNDPHKRKIKEEGTCELMETASLANLDKYRVRKGVPHPDIPRRSKWERPFSPCGEKRWLRALLGDPCSRAFDQRVGFFFTPCASDML